MTPARPPIAIRALLIAAALVASCSGSAPGPGSSPVGLQSSAAAASQAAAAPSATPRATDSPPPSATPLQLLGPLPTAALDAAMSTRLQAAVDRMVSDGAPDAIASVITANGVWAGAAGVDGPKGRKAQPEDVFGIASVSKPLLASLILRLAEQGKLDLDGPIATSLPGITVDANGATMRQALAMRSGIGTTVAGALERSLSECDRRSTKDEVLASIPKPFAAPGTTYEYSNPTYKLVGYAAEQVTGKSLADAMKAEILDPADIDGIVLQGFKDPTPKPWALPIAGHGSDLDIARFGTGGALPCLGFASFVMGASGVAADAASLARWGWALFAGDVIEPASLAAMTAVDADGHGLGIDRLWDFPPHVVYGHAGSMPGYAALLAVLPEDKTVVVVFVNDERADVYAEAKQLIDAIGG